MTLGSYVCASIVWEQLAGVNAYRHKRRVRVKNKKGWRLDEPPPCTVLWYRSYAIILPGSQRMSCGKKMQSSRPVMIQNTNGHTPLMMSAIVIPRLGSADPLR